MPSDFAKSDCISRPILFLDKKITITSSEPDRIINGLRPASSAVGSDGSFLFAAYTRKNVLRTEHFTAAARPRLTGHGSSPKLRERMRH